MLAQDLLEELVVSGAEVLGPVACMADALAVLEAGAAPDLAILDIRLADETVFPVADALRLRGIPFVFATGYDAWVIPDCYAAVPRAEKLIALRGAPLAPHMGARLT